LALYRQGQRALPHGTCSGVGIAGHALHGGYGYGSRKWGLTLDHIVALDVVLANGTQIHTTETDYPDIFFAMRGAGDSFGIVTYLYLQTEPAPSSVVYFTAGLAAALEDVDIVTSAFENLQNYSLTSLDITPNITFGMYTDSAGSFSISGWCMECDHDVFQNDVFPAMLEGFPSPTRSVTELGWIEALTTLAGPDPLEEPLGSDYTKHDTFYAKSLVVKNDEPLTTATIRASGPISSPTRERVLSSPSSISTEVPALKSTSHHLTLLRILIVRHYGCSRTTDTPRTIYLPTNLPSLQSSTV
jgi:hypothetical protein